jgi:hypothetical protein
MSRKSATFVFVSGSPGAANIGNFLLKNKEFFLNNFSFKMKRITAQEIGKYSKTYKILPALKIGEKKWYGEQEIVEFLSSMINPPKPPEPTSHEEFISPKRSEFKIVNGKIVFNEKDDEDEEDFEKNFMKKHAEFNKKKGGRIDTVEEKVAGPAQPEIIDDPEADLEQWRLHAGN